MRQNTKKKPPSRTKTEVKKPRSWSDIQAEAYDLDAYINEAPELITSFLLHSLHEIGRLTMFPVPTWAPEESKEDRLKTLAELLGQAMLHSIDLTESKYRVRRALYELLHNPDCPAELYDRCGQFVCDASNAAGNIFHSDVVLAELLKSIPAEGLRSAIQNQEASHAK